MRGSPGYRTLMAMLDYTIKCLNTHLVDRFCLRCILEMARLNVKCVESTVVCSKSHGKCWAHTVVLSAKGDFVYSPIPEYLYEQCMRYKIPFPQRIQLFVPEGVLKEPWEVDKKNGEVTAKV